MDVEAIAKPPEIPSKFDVIPIHASDVSNYMRCRRYWNWASPARNNLRRKVQIHGIDTNLWFGTGIHYALQLYYDPILKRDPVETWKTWWTWQWEGGSIQYSELEMAYDPTPVGHGEKVGDHWEKYSIRGLRDMLPDPDHEEFEELLDLGLGMMKFYKEYSKKYDDFVVIAAEAMFSIPLGFEAVDHREQSPNYGKKLEVHARGRRDTILYAPESQNYGVMDHKTAGKIDDAYFAKLDMDAQCSQYIWATQEEAILYDLPYTQINWVLYQALRKVYPKPPSILKSGMPSLDRQKESTTADLFKECIVGDPSRKAWYESNQKAQGYYSWLCEIGDANFIQRDYARRNQHEINHFGANLKLIAQEMLSEPALYPHPTSDWLCLRCQFRPPCLAKNDGSDWEAMIEDGYERNVDR